MNIFDGKGLVEINHDSYFCFLLYIRTIEILAQPLRQSAFPSVGENVCLTSESADFLFQKDYTNKYKLHYKRFRFSKVFSLSSILAIWVSG